ncbi:hypothetical protein GUJ93_ZPchr0013g35405 [Zizania palustris]|uniref:CR-type domain-containing protein n=1 Tax=Zizania palustris TaxID=103762 RepID=A0A8J6BWN4_ZIZPA|nr:hypothetical protein GUJ93_ZPchr0013g35405 [Zizania palustris]
MYRWCPEITATLGRPTFALTKKNSKCGAAGDPDEQAAVSASPELRCQKGSHCSQFVPSEKDPRVEQQELAMDVMVHAGLKTITRQIGLGMTQQMNTVCPECRGSGEMISEKDKCPSCKGDKVVQEKILEVHVEKGINMAKRLYSRVKLMKL